MQTNPWLYLSPATLLVLLTVTVGGGEAAPAAASLRVFEDVQHAAQAENPPGVTCTLRALDGKTRFQQGATIRLAAAFSSDRPGYKLIRYDDGRRGMSPFGTIHVAPQEGVADPLADLPPPHGWSYSGPPPPAPVVLSDKPFEMPLVLNEWLRFDRPGAYRVYVTTRRVLPDTGKPAGDGFSGMLGPGPRFETTSDILQLEIVPADPTCARTQVEAQKSRWADRTQHYTAQPRLEGEVQYLGTPEAAQAILEQMGDSSRPRSSADESWFWRPALVAFPDRDWLIAEMQRTLVRPDYAVTQGFLTSLALLSAQRRMPHPAGADATPPHYTRNAQGKWVSQPTPPQRLQSDWEERLDQAQTGMLRAAWQRLAQAVAAKLPAARAVSLHTLLELAWLNHRLGEDARVQARVPQLVTWLAPVFDRLPPLPQGYLLGNEWPNIKSRAFLPALLRLWNAAQLLRDGQRPDLSDLILRRIHELSPQTGRAFILNEMISPRPRVSFAALRILPDTALPTLDEKLVDNLEHRRSNDELPALLIARYASPAAAPRLQKLLDDPNGTLAYSFSVPLAVYFLRVDPVYGKQVAERLLVRTKNDTYTRAFSEMAALQMGPLLEQLAIAHLDDASAGVEADAADMLGHYGSPGAKPALMARLKRIQDLQYPKVRERVELALVTALTTAQGWLCSDQDLRAIRDLCQTPQGLRYMDDYLRPREVPKVHVHYQMGERGYWGVGRYSGRGLETLRAKLAQFPRGTIFSWQTLSYGAAETGVFHDLQLFVHARGTTLEREDVPRILQSAFDG